MYFYADSMKMDLMKGGMQTAGKVKDNNNRSSAVSHLLPAASVEERLAAAEEVVYSWGSNSDTPSRRWEDSSGDVAAYLYVADEILALTDALSLVPAGELAVRAENVLQLAMTILEDEFRCIVMRNAVPPDVERTYGSALKYSQSLESMDRYAADDFSGAPVQEEGSAGTAAAAAAAAAAKDSTAVELFNADAIRDLKELAERMIRAGYEKECCRVYSSVRCDVHDEYLFVLGMEKQGIEEVQKIGWTSLNEKMKKWIRAVTVVIRVLLPAEKRLCFEQIFVGSEVIRDVFFGEIAKGCVMQLMTFGEAISVGERSPEKLFRILDMHDALVDLLPDLRALFEDCSSQFVCEEVQGIRASLGEAVKGTLSEFEKAVQSEASRKPILGGDIHPLTRYTMNYVNLIMDYTDSLNSLLVNDAAHQVADNGDDCHDRLQLGDGSPLSSRLQLLVSHLESNLEDKSKFYENRALQYIFLMNNILYIVQKVKASDLRRFMGDLWVRRHQGRIRQYSTAYLRASWRKLLSCLRDEGIWGGGNSSNVSKISLKERFKSFNLCFEDIYRTQTAWKVTDPQLAEELRISISEKVIPAYRSFLWRFRGHIESGKHSGRYIKYMPEDLEKYLLHLFEGVPGVLHHMRKKSSV